MSGAATSADASTNADTGCVARSIVTARQGWPR